MTRAVLKMSLFGTPFLSRVAQACLGLAVGDFLISLTLWLSPIYSRYMFASDFLNDTGSPTKNFYRALQAHLDQNSRSLYSIASPSLLWLGAAVLFWFMTRPARFPIVPDSPAANWRTQFGDYTLRWAGLGGMILAAVAGFMVAVEWTYPMRTPRPRVIERISNYVHEIPNKPTIEKPGIDIFFLAQTETVIGKHRHIQVMREQPSMFREFRAIQIELAELFGWLRFYGFWFCLCGVLYLIACRSTRTLPRQN